MPPEPPPPPPPVLADLDLERATVLDLQRAMATGRLTAAALAGFYLERIRAVDPLLHAVIETAPDAERQATASDARRRRHRPRSPLEGIPVLLKDNIDTADGLATTAGSLALVGARPARDAWLVERLRAAGAIVLGKANLSEWANYRSTRSSSGWSARGGQTHHPYARDRNPGGSSSGSAVGVAASLATIAFGTETNGSIVYPAAATGVVGLKPTLGLVSRAGIVPISARQDTAGPLARSVTDAAAALAAVQGPDPRDPATAAAAGHTGRDYLAALDPAGLTGVRIGIWREPAADQPEVAATLDGAVAALRCAGAVVVDDLALPGVDKVSDAQGQALPVEFKHDLNAYLAATPGDHPGDLAGLIAFNEAHADRELPHFGQETFTQAQATGGDLTDPAYRQAREAATGAARTAIDTALADHRLAAIAAPTNGPAWLTDLARGDDRDSLVASSTPAAVAGYPNLTVPAGYARGHLPLGISFFGGRFSEPVLITIGYAFEQATRVRVPPSFLPTLP